MRKTLKTSVIALFLLSMILSACGGKTNNTTQGNQGEQTQTTESPSDTKSQGPVTIRIALLGQEVSENEVKAFEAENPGIKIQIEEYDTQKLAAQLATRDAPDIIRAQGAVDMTSYIVKGVAMDITSYVEKSTVLNEDDFLPVVNLYRFDGKVQGQGPLYGMPKDWSPDFTIFYNKKLFDAADVPLPDPNKPLTWNELIDLSKKLTLKEGDKVKQYGLAGGEPGLGTVMLNLASKGVNVFSEDMKTADFTKPEVKENLSLWVDAVQSNIGKNVVNQDPAGWDGELFMNDKAAMIIAGYWFSGMIRGDENKKTHLEDFGMMAAPIAEGGKRVSPTGAATGYFINKDTAHPDEAFKVFEYIMGGQPAKDRATGGWGVPVLKSLLPLMPQETDFDKRVFDQLQEELKYSDVGLEINPFFLNGQTLLSKYITPVYFNKATLDDALKDLTKNANLIIKESMNAVGN